MARRAQTVAMLGLALAVGCGRSAPRVARDAPPPAARDLGVNVARPAARDAGVAAPTPSSATRAAPRTRTTHGPDDVVLAGSDVAFGLRLPAGATRTVELPDAIDVRVAMPLERVAGHVRAQLALPLVEETAADGLRYPAAHLATPAGAPPITVLLLPMPRGDVLVRVRRLGTPQQPLDPVTARRMNE